MKVGQALVSESGLVAMNAALLRRTQRCVLDRPGSFATINGLD